MIRFISFDLWLTLIKSNPHFKQKRAEFIADKYNPNGLSAESVFNIIREIDRASDQLNETTGKKLATELMYSAILQQLGFTADSIHHNLLLEIKSNINDLFFQFQPMLLNENIINMLIQLKSDGYALNISSNTGFIEGSYMMKILKLMELDTYFDFAVFSDEINASKPSPVFYEHVFKSIKGEKHEVMHIGDNYNADFIGAQKFGFNALLIDNKEYSIELVKSKIDEKNRELQCLSDQK